LPDEKIALTRQVGSGEIGRPVHSRRLGKEVRAMPEVVGLDRIVRVRAGRVARGDRRFERQDVACFSVGVRMARKLQDLRDMRPIVRADVGLRRISISVGVETEAALHDMRQIAVRLGEALMDPNAEDAVGGGVGAVIETQRPAQRRRQASSVVDCVDGCEFGSEGSDALRFDRLAIGGAGVEVADLPLERAVGSAGRRL